MPNEYHLISSRKGGRKRMNLYTLFAISCYIILRGLQVLLEEYKVRKWYKVTIKTWTVVMLYAALANWGHNTDFSRFLH